MVNVVLFLAYTAVRSVAVTKSAKHRDYYRELCIYCMSVYSLQSDTMATEGEPTDLIKVLHLLVLSFSWGMQVWVSFIAGATGTIY